MSTQDPGRAPQAAALTSLPRLEDLPQLEGGGYDREGVRDAFDAFRRHALQLQAQLRVLQAAGKRANVEPTGHAVRMDALHLIRAAAEFADALERDAQNASAAQLGRTEEEVRRRQRELQERQTEIDRFREESERLRNEILNAAKNEARELLANANTDATTELRETEARGARLLEQARHQATELTNAARAEVEQTLEWARTQGSAIMARAQQGAEQLLTAAGLGPDALAEVSAAIVEAARASTEASRQRATPSPEPPRLAPVAGPPPVAEPEAQAESEPEPEAEGPPVSGAPDVEAPAEPVLPPVTPPPPPVSGGDAPQPSTSPAGTQDEDQS
jgi:F0F1-type ATP synthase membrane subunit b/b'